MLVATAVAGETLVSSTVKDIVTGSGITFADRGMHGLKGVPGESGYTPRARDVIAKPLRAPL